MLRFRRYRVCRQFMVLSSIFLIFFSLSICLSHKALATTSTLTISIADTIELDVMPSTNGSFAASTATNNISVRTNNGTGYDLGIKASTNNSNALNRTGGGSIPSITSSITEEAFRTSTAYNDKWGYKPSKINSSANSNYLQAPTSSSTATRLDKTTTANPSTNNNYTITIGTRVTKALPSGTYSNTFVIVVVSNPAVYSITYNANGGSDTVTNMPSNVVNQETYSDTVNISNTVPARDGYSFKGWCTVQTADGGTCTGTTYNPDGEGTDLIWTTDQTATSNSLNLYANWEEINIEKAYAIEGKTKYSGYYKLQDMSSSICNRTHTGSSISQLIDTRDNEVYYVSKLKDNKCWMLDNLRLGGGSTISLNSSNTNIPGNYNLPASVCNTYTTGCINASYKNNIPTHYGNSSGKRGVYYNYCAASGGTYCYSSSTANASYDVCPKNWRMPTGGGSGEFSALCNAITGLDCSEDKDVPMQGTNPNTFQYQLGLSDTGYIDPGFSSNPVEVNTRTLIWASTYQRNNAVMMGVSASGTYTNAAGGGYRHLLFTVRCLAK